MELLLEYGDIFAGSGQPAAESLMLAILEYIQIRLYLLVNNNGEIIFCFMTVAMDGCGIGIEPGSCITEGVEFFCQTFFRFCFYKQ